MISMNQSVEDIVQALQGKPEETLAVLREIAPVLYTIVKLNSKFLRDMKYGEIHLTEFVKNGKLYRVEGFPMIGELVEE